MPAALLQEGPPGAPALVLGDGRVIDRAELREMVGDFGRQLGETRRLVLLSGGNDLAAVVAYLACIEGGHPVLLAGPEHQRLVDVFRPDILIRDGQLERVDNGPRSFHPDLAVLLSTSGSTGSPKLVRLSHANIEANARSIAEYLAIAPDDRAITSLPVHYSYGLSVLNSHLIAGASVVLTDHSVIDPEFWTLFRAVGVTSIAGVPYSYELFERIGLRDDPPPTLRTMTQAGGRLPPEMVTRYARFARDRGIRFFVMYGQTEATARMAYLPPEMTLDHPTCIGVAIPGGHFDLRDGELIYRGPNVMMGYATAPEDLARGAELTELATGDLAVREDSGLYRITGRASRFAKIAGLRIGFDDVEALLRQEGIAAAVTGDDSGIAICVTGGATAAAVRELVAERCHLPLTAIATYVAEEAPRLPSGKTDFTAIRTEARRHAEADAGQDDRPVAALYARVTGRSPVGDEDSFATLGGDSLSYVEASVGLERLLGQLPAAWETLSVARLEALAGQAGTKVSGLIARIESEVLLRVAAILMVIIGHAAPDQTEFLRGGSGVLMMLAGYNLARFQSGSLLAGQVGIPIRNAIERVILPYFVMMAALLAVSKADPSIGWPLLISNFTVEFRGPLFAYWFIETLFHALLILCALFLIPPVRRLAAAQPFGFAVGLVLLGGAMREIVPMFWTDGREKALTVDAWFYAYAVGWGLRIATGRAQKAAIFALAALLFLSHWGPLGLRGIWPLVAAAVLLTVSTVALPALFARALKDIAANSYFIYLTHVLAVHVVLFVLFHESRPLLDIPLILVLSLLLGLGFGWCWRLGTRALAAPRQTDVAAIFASVLGHKVVRPDRSLADMAADSLSYVSLSVGLEARLGRLPEGWEHMPVSELQALADRHAGDTAQSVGSEILLRALAILSVIVNHASDLPVGGGSDALLLLAGFGIARFQGEWTTGAGILRALRAFAIRVILPYYAILLLYALAYKHVPVEALFLLGNFADLHGTFLEPFWFIEALFQCLLIFAGLMLIPPVRQLAATQPERFGWWLLGGALAAKTLSAMLVDYGALGLRTPEQVFFLLAFGWQLYFGRGTRAALLLGAIALAMAVLNAGLGGLWPDSGGLHRGAWLVGGALLLLYVRRVPMPPLACLVVLRVAQAAFVIYLTHQLVFFALHRVNGQIPVWIEIVAALIFGVALNMAGAVWTKVLRGGSGQPNVHEMGKQT